MVRVGLVGLGQWGRKILKTLEVFPFAQVTRVVSTNPTSANLIPAGCVVRESWQKVVEADDVDAVIVATPAKCHAEMTLAALQAGKSVFVEKPVAMTVREAVEIEKTDVNSTLHVNHLDLFNPAWIALKNHLWRIGKILSVEAVFGSKSDRVVSALWDWAPHPIVLCFDLLGDPKSVLARQYGDRLKIDSFYRNSSACFIDVSTSFEPKERKLTVVGENGKITYDDNATHKVVVSGDGWTENLEVAPTPPLECALRRFLGSVNRREPYSDGPLGTAVVGVLERAERCLAANT